MYRKTINIDFFDKNIYNNLCQEINRNEIKLYDYTFIAKISVGVSNLKEKLPFKNTIKLKEIVRSQTNSILEAIENNNIIIDFLEVNIVESIESNLKINLQENGERIYKRTTKTNSRKMHIKINIPSIEYKLNEIFDSIEFPEGGYFIDERNKNKELFNQLLLSKIENKSLEITNLSKQDWLQLILKEKVTIKELANLYNISENQINKHKKLYIQNIKEYKDEYLFFETIMTQVPKADYYSNFCLIILEIAKNHGIKYIYKYDTQEYELLFNIEEEIKKQQEIEKQNIKGKTYITPLSGIILNEFLNIINNRQVDRKILKNDYFLKYYSSSFLKSIQEHIIKILPLYKTNQIYKHPEFKTYQELYKRGNIKLKETQELELIETRISQEIKAKKKAQRTIKPKNYIEIEKTKIKNGENGQDLVYNYEKEKLKNYPNLQKQIEKKYTIDEGCGYDIQSFDTNGNVIYIEVKTSQSSNKKKISFNISKNEDEFILNHKNAYIYYVFDLANPKLRIINRKDYIQFNKEIANYTIKQDCIIE